MNAAGPFLEHRNFNRRQQGLRDPGIGLRRCGGIKSVMVGPVGRPGRQPKAIVPLNPRPASRSSAYWCCSPRRSGGGKISP